MDEDGAASELELPCTLTSRGSSEGNTYILRFVPVADLIDIPQSTVTAIENAFLRRTADGLDDKSGLLGSTAVLSVDSELVFMLPPDQARQLEVGRSGLTMLPSVRTTKRSTGAPGGDFLVVRAKAKCMSSLTMQQKIEQAVRARRDPVREFLGQQITTTHGARSRRSYLVAGIAKERAGEHYFENNGTKVNVVQYFQERYHLSVRPDDYLLMVVERKASQKIGKRALERIAAQADEEGGRPLARIPAGRCYPVGMTEEDRKDSSARRDMVQKASIPAPLSLQRTEGVAGALQQLDASIGAQATVNATYLGPAPLHAAQGSAKFLPQAVNEGKSDGNFNLAHARLGSGKDWGAVVGSNYIFVTEGRSAPTAQRALRDLQDKLRLLGVGLPDPRYHVELSGRGQGTEWMDRVAAQYDQAPMADKPHFVLAMLPAQDEGFYYGLKAYSLFGRLPIPSQFLVLQREGKKLEKVAVQLAAKLNRNVYGSVSLPANLAALSGGQPYMVAGIATEPGVATMTFTLDKTACRTATVFADCERGRQALPVGELLVRALSVWNKNSLSSAKVAEATGGRGFWPQFIYVYRTGASEGVVESFLRPRARRTFAQADAKSQLDKAGILHTLKGVVSEADQLAHVLNNWSVYNDCTPSVMFASIQADSDVRLWDQSNAGGTANVPNGTIIDGVIVPEDTFVYVPCETHMAMGRPIEHQLIYAAGPAAAGLASGDADAAGRTKHLLHYILRDMCSLYFNWQGPVRLPAPLQKAKRAAELIMACSSKASSALQACAAAASASDTFGAGGASAAGGFGDSGVDHSVAGHAAEGGFASVLAQLAPGQEAHAVALGQLEL